VPKPSPPLSTAFGVYRRSIFRVRRRRPFFDAADNGLGPEGVEALAGALKGKTAMAQLYVDSTSKGATGGPAMATAVEALAFALEGCPLQEFRTDDDRAFCVGVVKMLIATTGPCRLAFSEPSVQDFYDARALLRARSIVLQGTRNEHLFSYFSALSALRQASPLTPNALGAPTAGPAAQAAGTSGPTGPQREVCHPLRSA
jgi:hypothetical protein